MPPNCSRMSTTPRSSAQAKCPGPPKRRLIPLRSPTIRRAPSRLVSIRLPWRQGAAAHVRAVLMGAGLGMLMSAANLIRRSRSDGRSEWQSRHAFSLTLPGIVSVFYRDGGCRRCPCWKTTACSRRPPRPVTRRDRRSGPHSAHCCCWRVIIRRSGSSPFHAPDRCARRLSRGADEAADGEPGKAALSLGRRGCGYAQEPVLEGAEALRKAYVLIGGLIAGLLVGVFNTSEGTLRFLDRIFLKTKLHLPELVPAAGYASINGRQLLGFGFEPSALLIGAGMIIGLRVTLSMLAGSLLLYVWVGPALIAMDAAHLGEAAYKISIPLIGGGTIYHLPRWALWGGTATMVFSSLAAFGLQWQTIARSFSMLRRAGRPPRLRSSISGSPPLKCRSPGWSSD